MSQDSQDSLSPTVRAALSRVREAVDTVLNSLEVIDKTLTSAVPDIVILRDTGVVISFLGCDDDD